MLLAHYPLLSSYFTFIAEAIATSGVFYLFEKMYPTEKSQPFSAWLFNLVYLMTFLALIFLISPYQQKLLNTISRHCGGGFFDIPVTHLVLAKIGVSILYGFFWDFCQYWMHRTLHASRFLWEVHRFHHSDRHLNATTQGRNHIFSDIVSVFFILVPFQIVFKNIAPSPYAVFIFFQLWGYFNHMNVRMNLKWLTPIISGAQWHRIHHSIKKHHYDKNFAAFFPIWDILFGTYYRPEKNEYPATGLDDGENLNHLWRAYIHPFTGWKNLLKNKLETAL